MPIRTEPFPAEALTENRSGHLTADQASKFRRMVSGRRASVRGVALPVGAIGVLLLVLSGPGVPAVTRHLVGWGFLALAAVLLTAPALDPLAADVRNGRIEPVEGAIAKRRVQSMSLMGFTRYYLKVDHRELQTYRAAYDSAPDAGYVRAYYLPRTRRLVNLERLPNPSVPSSPDEVREVFGRISRASRGGDPGALAQARAGAAGLMDAVRESIIEPSDSSGGPDGGLTREALVGHWTHPLLTANLAADGSLIIQMLSGKRHTGHWSVDGRGRLLIDATGTMQQTEATVDGNRLTLRFEGRYVTFTRAAIE